MSNSNKHVLSTIPKVVTVICILQKRKTKAQRISYTFMVT